MPPVNDWIQLQDDVRPYLPSLTTAAETVIDQDVSNYPVFFAYGGEENNHAPGLFVLEIFTPRGTHWRVNVSTLEELVARQVVDQAKIDPFRTVYKNNPAALCFLIVDAEGARFGFVPKA